MGRETRIQMTFLLASRWRHRRLLLLERVGRTILIERMGPWGRTGSGTRPGAMESRSLVTWLSRRRVMGEHITGRRRVLRPISTPKLLSRERSGTGQEWWSVAGLPRRRDIGPLLRRMECICMHWWEECFTNLLMMRQR